MGKKKKMGEKCTKVQNKHLIKIWSKYKINRKKPTGYYDRCTHFGGKLHNFDIMYNKIVRIYIF